jgi:hypothetical protein
LLWNNNQISRTESLEEKFEVKKLLIILMFILNFILFFSKTLKPKDLESLLEMALLENNFGFVDALLGKGINLESFLTLERFDKLFNSRKVFFKNIF